jgi:hypothetical protein
MVYGLRHMIDIFHGEVTLKYILNHDISLLIAKYHDYSY